MLVRHILVQTDELAATILEQVKQGADFAELAQAISNCEHSRSKGGELGWVSSGDAHLDDILPISAREACLKYKPGDVHIVKTDRGVHLIKIEDVMTRLTTKSRKRGRLPGLGLMQVPLASTDKQGTYYLESMGCQMNASDSERMVCTVQT